MVSSKLSSYRRSAFTLIELLVVIAIIGVLVGLTLPAVQKVREAAARTQCSNNMRQISLATIAYESKWNRMPHSRTFQGLIGATGGSVSTTWAVDILPDIEQETIYQAYYVQVPRFNGISTSSVAGAPSGVKIYICPSRRKQAIDGSFAVGDYVGNAGRAMRANYDPTNQSTQTPLNDGTDIRNDSFHSAILTNQIFAGPFIQGPGIPVEVSGDRNVFSRKISMTDIKDGTANTLMFGEKFIPRAGLGQFPHDCSIYDGRGYATGLCSTRNGGTPFDVYPFDNQVPPPTLVGYGSAHNAGLNMAFCDGSVRFIAATNLNQGVLAVISTIAGGAQEGIVNLE